MPVVHENGVFRIHYTSPGQALRNLNQKLRNDKTISSYLGNKGYKNVAKAARWLGYGKRKSKRKTKAKPKQKGKGFFNTIINKLPVEFHYRGFDTGFKPYNFAGPGTRLDQRLDATGFPKPNSMPVNRVDQAAYEHDQFYTHYRDHNSRKEGDNIMIKQLDDVRNDGKARWTERADAAIVGAFMKSKRFLGLGVKAKRKGGCKCGGRKIRPITTQPYRPSLGHPYDTPMV